MIKRLLREHPLIVLHLATLVVLFLGLLAHSGTRYMHWLLLYAAGVVLVYVAACRLVPQRELKLPVLLGPDTLVRAVFAFLVLFAAFYWWRVGGPPTYQAVMAHDELAASDLRDAPKHETWVWLNYVNLMLIAALLPFTIAVAYSSGHRLFPWLLVCSMIYAASLLPKSYVGEVVIPLAILLMVRRAWWRLAALGLVCLALMAFLVWVANPDAGPPIGPKALGDEARTWPEYVLVVIGGITRRVLLIPGWTVAVWFDHIPKDIPWCEGAAVRPLAAVLGMPYADIPTRVYEIEFPDYVARGFHGTVPSAAFMYDYANFGAWGLLMAAVIVGGTFALLHRVFGLRGKWGYCCGTFGVIALATSAYTTVLLTHGLFLMVLLFLLVRPHDPERSA